jgi:hypothetical protein
MNKNTKGLGFLIASLILCLAIFKDKTETPQKNKTKAPSSYANNNPQDNLEGLIPAFNLNANTIVNTSRGIKKENPFK